MEAKANGVDQTKSHSAIKVTLGCEDCKPGIYSEGGDLIFIKNKAGACLWANRPTARAFCFRSTSKPQKGGESFIETIELASGVSIQFLVTVSSLPKINGSGDDIIGVAHPLLSRAQKRRAKIKNIAPWILTTILSILVVTNWILDIWQHSHFIRR